MNLVCGCRPWDREAFEKISKLSGEWRYSESLEEADRIFFLHWSWKVPSEILNRIECINFHMTDLPYGRGGSPLQNLILKGHKETLLTAFRMTDKIDAGPVYLKEPLSLDGTAEQILRRANKVAIGMIEKIIKGIEPREQRGKVTVFKRRTPDESRIPVGLPPKKLYNFIRMLDGGYPPAFIGNYQFTNAKLYGDHVRADISSRSAS